MKQTRLDSLEETLVNVVSGFCVALVIQLIFFPMFGIQITFSSNLLLTCIFTVASIIRSYCIRRIYNRYRGLLVRMYLKWRQK